MKSIITTSTIWIFVNYFVSLQCDCHQTQEIWEKMVDKQALRQEMVDKWSIKPSLAEKMVDILVLHGGNKNRTYSKKEQKEKRAQG